MCPYIAGETSLICNGFVLYMMFDSSNLKHFCIRSMSFVCYVSHSQQHRTGQICDLKDMLSSTTYLSKNEYVLGVVSQWCFQKHLIKKDGH